MITDSIIKDSFLTLLRMGLWGKREESLLHFPLDEQQWNVVWEIAVSQTVEGIVYEGVLLLPVELMPPQALLLRWVARMDTIERYNKKLREVCSILQKGFRGNGITCILLKGLGLGANYNNPNARVGGDIDLYFPKESFFEQANKLVASKKVKVHKGDHHSTLYSFRGVMVEHHTRMIDIFNPFVRKYLKQIQADELEKCLSLRIEDVDITIPSNVLAHVQANAHILKHYMGFGVGLRQFCDVARLSVVSDIMANKSRLQTIYKEIGLERWMRLVYTFLVENLGLPAECSLYPLKENSDTKKLLRDILESGNFGFHDMRFREENARRTDRYIKRDSIVRRIVPHILFLMRYVPQEVFWFPIFKVATKLIGR